MHCFNCLDAYDNRQATVCAHCGASLLIRDERAVKRLNSNRYSPVLETESASGERKVIRIVRDFGRLDFFQDVVMGLHLISRQSHHSFCPKVIDTFFWNFEDSDECIYCILLEKIEGLSLREYVVNHGASDHQVMTWMMQLFEMVDIFHGQSWLLRDIKPDNLMVNPEGRLIFVDIDSLLHWPWETDSPFLHLSSPGYTAPEQNDRRLSPASDLFSIGRTAIFCLTGRSPLELYDETGFTWRHELKKTSPLLLDFVDRLVALNPIERPSIRDSVDYLKGLPEKIRKDAMWKRYKWPITIVSGLLALCISIPLGRRVHSWNLRTRADQQLLAGDSTKAKELYERSIHYSSKNGIAYLGLGIACFEPQCGIDYLEKALELEPNNDLVIYNLASLYESSDIEKALKLYVSISPNSEQYLLAQNNIARLAIIQGNPKQAIAILDNIKDYDRISDELRAIIYKNEGWAYLKEADYKRAEKALRQSVLLNPFLGDSYCLLSSITDSKTHSISCLSENVSSPEARKIRTKILSNF